MAKPSRVPTDDRIEVWSNGVYVYATAGSEPDEFCVVVESPIRGNGDTRREEVSARQAVVSALAALRKRENGKYRKPRPRARATRLVPAGPECPAERREETGSCAG